MPQLLTSVAISATLDASAYIQGAQAKVAADQAMTDSGDAFAASLDKAATTTTNTAQKLTQSATAADRWKASFVDGAAEAQRFQRAVSQGNALLDAGKITNAEYAAGVGTITARWGDGTAAAGAHGKATDALSVGYVGLNFAGMELAHSVRAITDELVAGVSPMRAFTMEAPRLAQAWQEGGGLSGVGTVLGGIGEKLLGLVNPTTAAIAAAAAVGSAFAVLLLHAHDVDEQVRQFNLTLRDFGTAGLANGQQLEADVRQFQALGLAASDAGSAVAKLARTPGLDPASIGQLGMLGADVGAVLGTGSKAGIAAVTAAVNGGVDAIVKLAASVHGLTPEQETEILVLQRMQGAVVAANAALNDMSANLAGEHKSHLSDAAKTVGNLGAAWSTMLDKLSNTTAVTAAQSAITSLTHAATSALNIAASAMTPAAPATPLDSVNYARAQLGLATISAGTLAAAQGAPGEQVVATAQLPPPLPAGSAAGTLQSLVAAVIAAESGGNPNALSPAGAIGLMQLMPGTAASLGVNPWNAQQNVAGGTTYLEQMIARFGNVNAGLQAYNWGPANLQAALANGSPIPAGVQNYASGIVGAAGLTGNETLAQLGAPTNFIVTDPATQKAIGDENAALAAQQEQLKQNIPVWQQFGVEQQAEQARLDASTAALAKTHDAGTAAARGTQAYNDVITKANIDLDKQNQVQDAATAGLNLIAGAYGTSAAAGADMALQVKAAADAMARGGDQATQAANKQKELSQLTAQAAAQQSVQNAQFIDQQNDAQAQLQLEIASQGQSNDQIARQVYLLQQKQLIENGSAHLLPDELAARLASVNATAALVQQLTLEREQQQRIDDMFRSIGQTIDSTLTQAIANAFDPTKVTDWGQTIRTMLGSIVSQIAETEFIKPLIGSILAQLGAGGNAVSQFGNLFGAASGSNVAVLNSDGTVGSINLSTLTNGASLLNSVSGGGGLFGGTNSFLNKIGASLGFAGGSESPVITAADSGSFGAYDFGNASAVAGDNGLFGATTLGQFAGAIGGGFGGGELLNSLQEEEK
jgi:hypothetical protein